uniref:Uncharacterized protein n=1 Tax=Setaria italica TaxID=4555 RepID=K3Y1S3_SETIT
MVKLMHFIPAMTVMEEHSFTTQAVREDRTEMDPQASQLGEEVHAPADCTEAGQVPEEEEVEYAFEDEAPEEGTKKRLFEVVIELIPLLIRIYDISMGMMTTGFVTALGAKVGRVLEVGEAVLEVGEAVKDFKRVRVDFALEDSLKYTALAMLSGSAPDKELNEEGVRFGTELRTSPFKKELGRMLSFHVSTPPVKRGLNFSRSQKERLDGRVVGSSTAKRTVIAEVAEDLVHGVQKMAVDVIRPSTNVGSVANGRMQDEMLGVNERVCGIDLYNGSSDGTLSTQEESAKNKGAALPLNLHDRLLLAKSKTGGLPDRKSLVKSPGATKHINKSRKTNKSLKPEVIVQSLKELQSNGKLMGSLLAPMGAGLGSRALEEEKKVAGETQDALKRVAATNNLVGAKDKPHQAQ